jgi:uncharacterized protein YjbI with pentapeptide repeats
MLKTFEYFLSSKESHNNIINNLVKDFSQETKLQKESGAINWGTFLSKISMPTVLSVVNSFFKAPIQTIRLIDFFRDQKKYNTPEFQEAIIKSDATWNFVDNTADNLGKISGLLKNAKVNSFSDLFDEGSPLDAKGIEKIKGALKNPDVILKLKDLAASSIKPNPNYLELTSKLLEVLDTSPNASAYLNEKGKSIQKYIESTIDKQISSEAGLQKDWSAILKIPKDPELHNAKIKFLKENGIKGKMRDEVLKSNKIPLQFTDNLATYRLKSPDVNKILDIVPILLNSPGDLKKMVDSINKGEYSNIARDIINLAESKTDVKKYLNDNKEVFAKIIDNMMQSNDQFVQSGLSGQVYDLVPTLFNNPKALNEILDIYDKGEYSKMAPKIFDLISNDPEIKEYFSKNSKGFEKLATAMIQDKITQSQGKIAAETKGWKKLDMKARRQYLDTDSKWKDSSEAAKESMMKNEKLQDLGDTLSSYGIEKTDIGAIAHVAMLTFDNSKHVSTILEDFNKGDYTNMTKDVFNLFAESKEVREYLIDQKDFIGRIVKATVLNTPELKGVDVTDLVPFLLNHPTELKEIVGLVEKEKYNEIAPKIIELSVKDRGIANYLANNKVILTKAALKSTGFDKYKISDELSDILVHLTTEDNLPKLQKLAKLASQKKWIKVGAGLADLIAKDSEFRESLSDNKENIDKIIKMVLHQNPSLRKSISSLETGALANNILSDPGGVRDLLNAYESGSKKSLALHVAKFATKKIFDSEFRGAIYKSAVNWLYGKGETQQKVANAIYGALDRGDSPDRVVLSDFVQNYFGEMAEGIKSSKEKKEFLQQISDKSFFKNITIEKFGREPLKLHNLDINGNQFVNTKFNNVSFEGTKMTNVAFHGATFERVSLSGATIDKATLEGLLPAIRNGLKLKGVKIEGSLDGMDLKDISFVGADLSGVTSMKGANINGAILSGAILPKKKEILANVYGLKGVMFSKDSKTSKSVISDEIFQSNQKIICANISDHLMKKALYDGIDLTEKEKSALKNKITELYADKSEIGKRFRGAINKYPEQLLARSFPEKPESISNVSDYKGKASHQLTMVYNNIKEPAKIETALVADILADEVNTKLFGNGEKHGKDGLEVQKALTEALDDFAKGNKTPVRDILTSNLHKEIIAHFKHDASSKDKDLSSSEMVGKFKKSLNLTIGDGALNGRDYEVIESLVKSISKNLFVQGDNILKSYQGKSQIRESLTKALYAIKTENPDIDLKSIIEKNEKALVGSLERAGWFSGAKTDGLTKLYFENEKTTGNTLTNNVQTVDFTNLLKENIEQAIENNIEKIVEKSSEIDKVEIPKTVEKQKEKEEKKITKDIPKIPNEQIVENVSKKLDKKVPEIDKVEIPKTVEKQKEKEEKKITEDVSNFVEQEKQIEKIEEVDLNKEDHEMINNIMLDITKNLFIPDESSIMATYSDGKSKIKDSLTQALSEIKKENPDIDIKETLKANKKALVGSLKRGEWSWSGWSDTSDGLTKLYFENEKIKGQLLSDNVKTADFKESLKWNIQETIEGNIKRTVHKSSKINKNSTKHHPLLVKEKAKKIGVDLSKVSNKKKINNKPNNQKIKKNSKVLDR